MLGSWPTSVQGKPLKTAGRASPYVSHYERDWTALRSTPGADRPPWAALVAATGRVGDQARGHRFSLALRWRPSAPPSIRVTLAVDAALAVVAILDAAGEVPWWIFVAVMLLEAAVLVVYSRRAAVALAICSREETPRAWLNPLALPSGVVGCSRFMRGETPGS